MKITYYISMWPHGPFTYVEGGIELDAYVKDALRHVTDPRKIVIQVDRISDTSVSTDAPAVSGATGNAERPGQQPK